MKSFHLFGFLLPFGILLSLQYSANGLKCYECDMTMDDLCTSHPIETKSCTDGRCTIFRQERMFDNKITAFKRACESKKGCEDKTACVDTVIVLPSLEIKQSYTTCDTDLCNVGLGEIETATTASPVHVVPGIRISQASRPISATSVVPFTLVVLSTLLANRLH